ncbi:MAG: hypothetical protein QM767_04080 [Anaeromyxobacter sp.]
MSLHPNLPYAILALLAAVMAVRVALRRRRAGPLQRLGGPRRAGALHFVAHVGALSHLDHDLSIPVRQARRRMGPPAAVH